MENKDLDDPTGCEDPSKEKIKTDTVFTAKFNPKKYDYVVKYVDEDGNEVFPPKNVNQVDFDSEVTEESIEVGGYDLVSDKSKTIKIDTEKNEIVFVYKKKDYKVVFEEESGTLTGGDKKQTVKYNDTSSEPTVKPKDGYKFVGWTTKDENGNEILVKDINSIKITKDTVFTAKYEKIETPTTTTANQQETTTNKTTTKSKDNKKKTEEKTTKTTETIKVDPGPDNNNQGENTSTVSPQTGYYNYRVIMLFGIVVLMSFIGAIISIAKIKRNENN